MLLIAGDCAALRMSLGDSAPYGLMVGMFTILPMSNILAIACYRSLAGRTSGRPFFLGFGLSGVLAMLACFNFCLMVEAKQLHSINFQFAVIISNTDFFIQRYIVCFRNNDIRNLYYLILNISLLFSMTTMPQMFVALSGGWIARRYAKASDTT